jgi:hypothetical protein
MTRKFLDAFLSVSSAAILHIFVAYVDLPLALLNRTSSGDIGDTAHCCFLKISLATVMADIALGHPLQKAKWVIVSTSSASVTPFSLARCRWNWSCSVLPPAMSAATVTRLRSRFDNSSRSIVRLTFGG